MSGKIIATAPILNEEDYIWYVMDSIYDVVDKIILVEGSDDYSRRYDKVTGLSVDKTGEIIRAFKKQKDSQNKVIHIEAGRVLSKDPNTPQNKKFQSQYYQDYLNDGDFRILISGDEIFEPRQIYRAVEHLKDNRQHWWVVFEHLMFWKSFSQILRVKDFIDNQPRVSLWQEGLEFVNNNCIKMATGSVYDIESKRCYDYADKFKIWHMGWVREREKFIEKRIWTLNKAKELDEKRLEYLKTLDEEDMRFEAEYQGKMFTDQLAINEYVEPYTGPWPKVLVEHPWFNRTPEDFLRRK